MIRYLARVGIPAVLVVALAAACGDDQAATQDAPAAGCASASATPPNSAPSVYPSAASSADPCASAPAEEPAGDVTAFLSRDDERDGLDCDAEDKRKKEVPDCGFYAGPDNRTFVWWSWVQAGRATPPAGWSATAEVSRHRPQTARPAATRSADKPKNANTTGAGRRIAGSRS